ncbi:NAD(P)/FAD-dependent oxidoreductase [Cohnella fermenti]|uniref:Pyridine nucleotide-disulfide oxidoreductase n=1 Tax=Cohnella fermenti TaxID=2565925 RepID=A0A4S4BUI8_9BACL|nr:FAD-dependent oxidoreductase [Cohnella fermenti]THF78735.1 pyridine nucleotide-disulfide oxidoreductase [Cohnella fermenti]
MKELGTKELRCVIVGGGYAGIQAARELARTFRKEEAGAMRLRLALIDSRPYHLRKVWLFKPAAEEAADITCGWDRLLPEGAEFIQGTVATIAAKERQLVYADTEGRERTLAYDILVVAAGSVARLPEPEQGGIALAGPDAANRIREAWQANLRLASQTADPAKRKRLLSVAVAGAGISGMETAAELAHAMRKEAERTGGIAHGETAVYLLDARERLFPEGPEVLGRKLERVLASGGVTTLHGAKALKEAEGTVTLADGRTIGAGLCVWTLGLVPNPALRGFGLPLDSGGQVLVDECYRVRGADGIYAIGDCARIVDPADGRADGMTCKEGIAQAVRLARIVAADLAGKPAPSHRRFMDFYCFGLGPGRGMAWMRHWGIDIVIGGKLGWKLRQYAWSLAEFSR